MSWFGRARTTVHHSPSSLPLHLKDGKTKTLASLVDEVTPSCYLNPLLFNGHLQTAWTSVNRSGPRIAYKRRVFEAEEPSFAGSFAVDFVVDASPGAPDTSLPPDTTYYKDEEFENLGGDDCKPMLITLHGLTGGSYEPYLRSVLAPLVGKGGWEALVINSRGCANSKVTSGLLYNARSTWDIRQIVRWARRTWPNRPLFAVGYSLGANMLANYLGEEGSSCDIEAAVIISNPWALEVSNVALQNTFIGLEIYSRTMGRNLKKVFEKHREQLMKDSNIDLKAVERVKYLHEFDRAVQCPTWGYPTEGAYYRDASSVDSIFDIRVPCLVIHAEDDPIACKQAVPYEEVRQTPWIVILSTSLGGHLGWYQIGGGRWHAKPASAFLNMMAKQVDTKATKQAARSGSQGPARSSSFKSPFVFKPMRRKNVLVNKEDGNSPL